jgi:hypothetical protein
MKHPPPKRTVLAIALAAAIAITACAHHPDPAPPPKTQAEADEALQQADGVGGATAVAVPVARWLGAVILQMFQNIKLNVDVKLDNKLPPKD